MALLGNEGAQVKAPVDAVKAAAPVDAAVADKKAKKLEALKRFKERREERIKQQYQNALIMRDELTKAGLLDKLTEASRQFVNELCIDPSLRKATSQGTSSTFTALFGPNPKVGDKITLREAFDKTDKGKSTLEIWIRKQAEKGLIIKVIPNKDVKLTEYVIEALGK